MNRQPILGALAGKKTPTHADFVRRFFDTISDAERLAFANLPRCRDENQFIAAVVAVRSAQQPELPAGHPLGARP